MSVGTRLNIVTIYKQLANCQLLIKLYSYIYL